MLLPILIWLTILFRPDIDIHPSSPSSMEKDVRDKMELEREKGRKVRYTGLGWK